jgi:hypothetical protein
VQSTASRREVALSEAGLNTIAGKCEMATIAAVIGWDTDSRDHRGRCHSIERYRSEVNRSARCITNSSQSQRRCPLKPRGGDALGGPICRQRIPRTAELSGHGDLAMVNAMDMTNPDQRRDFLTQRAIRFFNRYGDELDSIGQLIKIRLEQLALAYTLENDLPREAVNVSARIKSLDSFLKKLERKKWPEFYYPTEVATDLVGTRVTCWLLVSRRLFRNVRVHRILKAVSRSG